MTKKEITELTIECCYFAADLIAALIKLKDYDYDKADKIAAAVSRLDDFCVGRVCEEAEDGQRS